MSNKKTFEEILQDFAKKIEKNAKKIQNQFVIEAEKLRETPELSNNFNEKLLELQQETEEKLLELQQKKQKDLQVSFIEILNINENANYITLPIFEREEGIYILQIPYHYTLKAITVINDLSKKIHKIEEQTLEFYQNTILSLNGVNLLEKISLNRRNLAELKDFDFENEPFGLYPMHACHIPSIVHILGMWIVAYQEVSLKKKIINLETRNITGVGYNGQSITLKDKEYVINFSQDITPLEQKLAMLFLRENIHLTPETVMKFNLAEQMIFERMDDIKAQYHREMEEKLTKK